MESMRLTLDKVAAVNLKQEEEVGGALEEVLSEQISTATMMHDLETRLKEDGEFQTFIYLLAVLDFLSLPYTPIFDIAYKLTIHGTITTSSHWTALDQRQKCGRIARWCVNHVLKSILLKNLICELKLLMFFVDLPSESTDNYQHNIPVQEFQGSSGTKEPANEDQPSTSPEKNLEQDPDQIPDIENELETREERERKLLENNNIKHLYKSHIKVNRKPSTCKRKLFESEISNTETAPRRKKTTFDLVVQLLGPSSDVDDCIKYRELKLKHPGHKSFVSAFDQSFSKLQIEVSKRYFALKDKTAKDEGKENRENLLADKEIAQKLLDHWGVYYF
ncbi:unnamed protein product [Mytilus edulis]|uniref:Uncharacterized protein n=1 Tax=Mytilus edulis TaxID=6550 RepID=A0A8S3QD85_MYTED|nr:unnamed protein product [Mytilus edulis]